jgi:hypothetical protein
MIIGFGNNVVSSLAADITATQTTIQVMPGAGALFAGLLTYDYVNDSNPLKTYAKITLTDAKETVFEVCHLTAVNNDRLTVVRGQEGTAAKGWSLNDVIANFATRGSENQFVQIEQLQSGHYTSAVAGGTANGLTLALPATYFLNGSTEWALKTPILIYPTLSNTGASTLQLTMGGRVMGTYPLVKGSNTALRAGDIVAKNPFLAVFNAGQGRFIVLNPTTDVGSVRSVNAIGPDAGGNVGLPMYGLGMGPQHKDDAFSNVAQIYRINSSSASTPGGSVYGVICLPCDGAPSAAYLGAGSNGELHVGRSTTASKGVLWNRVYTTAYRPTAADVNAADVRNNFAARMGVARVLSGSNPPTSPGVWSVENCSWTPEKWGTLLCTTNKAVLSTARGEGQFLHYLFISHSSKVYVATNVNGNGAGWQQLIGPAGGNLSGPVSSSSWISAASMTAQYHTVPTGMPEGAGAFSGQLNSKAPLYQSNWQWPVTADGLYVPIVKGVSTRQGQGYPTAVSFGYLMDGSGSFARPCIHARGDNNEDAVWQFNPNDLMLYAPGGIKAGGATLATDGNIMGSRWGNKWLWDAIIEQVNGRVDWGAYNRDVGARATYDYVNQNFIQNVRYTAETQHGAIGVYTYHDNTVLTGFNNRDGDYSAESLFWSYIQIYKNGQWLTIGR